MLILETLKIISSIRNLCEIESKNHAGSLTSQDAYSIKCSVDDLKQEKTHCFHPYELDDIEHKLRTAVGNRLDAFENQCCSHGLGNLWNFSWANAPRALDGQRNEIIEDLFSIPKDVIRKVQAAFIRLQLFQFMPATFSSEEKKRRTILLSSFVEKLSTIEAWRNMVLLSSRIPECQLEKTLTIIDHLAGGVLNYDEYSYYLFDLLIPLSLQQRESLLQASPLIDPIANGLQKMRVLKALLETSGADRKNIIDLARTYMSWDREGTYLEKFFKICCYMKTEDRIETLELVHSFCDPQTDFSAFLRFVGTVGFMPASEREKNVEEFSNFLKGSHHPFVKYSLLSTLLFFPVILENDICLAFKDEVHAFLENNTDFQTYQELLHQIFSRRKDLMDGCHIFLVNRILKNGNSYFARRIKYAVRNHLAFFLASEHSDLAKAVRDIKSDDVESNERTGRYSPLKFGYESLSPAKHKDLRAITNKV